MRSKLTLILILIGLSQIFSASYILMKAHLSVYLIESAWQKSLEQNRYFKPWSWADTYPIAELKVKRLNNETFILAGSSGRNLAFSATHLSQSGLPGESKTIVFSAHKDTHFSFLENIVVGDEIYVATLKHYKSYKVSDLQIVNSQQSKIQIKNTEELLLTTCYPFSSTTTGGPLRFVVRAIPI